MIGVVVVTVIFYMIHAAIGFDFMEQRAGALGVAVVHTLFNILSTVILFPFCNAIERITVRSIKGKDGQEEIDAFATLDDRFLAMPAFAVEKCKELVCDMALLSGEALKKATGLMEHFDEKQFEEVRNMEAISDKYEDKTSSYLVKIAEHQMSAKDSKVVTELLHCVGDIERISDHALNIAKVAKESYDKQVTFSEKARADIAIIAAAAQEILDISINALANDDVEIAKTVEPLEQVIDRLKRKIKNGHISRLRQGDCTMELGFMLSDLLTNYERISDHCSNIAACVIEIANDSFEVHEYLSQVKAGGPEFDEMYQAYKQKYYIKKS
jgi:phosphate:Na+ symporter